MVELKITIIFCLALSAAIHAASNPSENNSTKDWLRISRSWLEEYGCPREGHLFIDCNYCYCKDDSLKSASCTRMACHDPVVDPWEDGMPCAPGTKFFAKCSFCTCNLEGTRAICDDRACEYYPEVFTKVESKTEAYDDLQRIIN